MRLPPMFPWVHGFLRRIPLEAILAACQSRTVAAAADCFGAVATSSLVKVSNMSLIAGGGFKLSFQTEAGKTYRVQRNNSLNESTWTDLKTVVGTGADLPVPDPSVSSEPSQFYRVIEFQ